MSFSYSKKIVEGIELYYLQDSTNNVQVTIVPKIGNNAFSLVFQDRELLWFPFESIKDFKQKPRLCGIPLLAPWANRLDPDSIRFDDLTFQLQNHLGNIKYDDNHLPIHGLLSASPYWEVVETQSTPEYAKITSRLDFWKCPEYMAHFPIAHQLEMSHILYAEELCVTLTIKNLSHKRMPVHIGFHPYFQLPRSERKNWKFKIPAAVNHILNQNNLPTGQTQVNQYQTTQELGGIFLDHLYSGILGQKTPFEVRNEDMQIQVIISKEFPAAVVYAPLNRDVICIEPMSGLTNAINDHIKDWYDGPELQFIEPGRSWNGQFSILLRSLNSKT